LPLTLVLIWAAMTYLVGVFIERHVSSTGWQVALVVVSMMPLALVVYCGYVWIDGALAPAPDNDTLGFRLKMLYHTRGVPEELTSAHGFGIRMGAMDKESAMRGVRRRRDELGRRYVLLIQALVNESGKGFDAGKIVERDGEIRRLITELKEGVDERPA